MFRLSPQDMIFFSLKKEEDIDRFFVCLKSHKKRIRDFTPYFRFIPLNFKLSFLNNVHFIIILEINILLGPFFFKLFS